VKKAEQDIGGRLFPDKCAAPGAAHEQLFAGECIEGLAHSALADAEFTRQCEFIRQGGAGTQRAGSDTLAQQLANLRVKWLLVERHAIRHGQVQSRQVAEAHERVAFVYLI
jgi:hypothetical protein